MADIRWLSEEIRNSKEYEWPGKLLPGFARRAPRACFSNSQELVLQRPRLRYVEGTAWQAGMAFPVHHGWAINDSDQVIDTTWTDRKRTPRIYRGAVVAHHVDLARHVFETGRYDPYLCCMSDWCVCINLLDYLQESIEE